MDITKNQAHTSTVISKAQQHLYFWEGWGEQGFLKTSSSTSTDYSDFQHTVWYGSCTEQDQRALQCVLRTAQNIASTQLPACEDINLSRCQCRASKIIRGPTHPAHHLFELLPSGRRAGLCTHTPQACWTAFVPELWKNWTVQDTHTSPKQMQFSHTNTLNTLLPAALILLLFVSVWSHLLCFLQLDNSGVSTYFHCICTAVKWQ